MLQPWQRDGRQRSSPTRRQISSASALAGSRRALHGEVGQHDANPARGRRDRRRAHVVGPDAERGARLAFAASQPRCESRHPFASQSYRTCTGGGRTLRGRPRRVPRVRLGAGHGTFELGSDHPRWSCSPTRSPRPARRGRGGSGRGTRRRPDLEAQVGGDEPRVQRHHDGTRSEVARHVSTTSGWLEDRTARRVPSSTPAAARIPAMARCGRRARRTSETSRPREGHPAAQTTDPRWARSPPTITAEGWATRRS